MEDGAGAALIAAVADYRESLKRKDAAMRRGSAGTAAPDEAAEDGSRRIARLDAWVIGPGDRGEKR